MATDAEKFQASNRSAEVALPEGAKAIVVLVLFGDKSLAVHTGADAHIVEAMVAGAADMYGVGPGDVGSLGQVHDPFGNKQAAIA
jgi:hypothetical protein